MTGDICLIIVSSVVLFLALRAEVRASRLAADIADEVFHRQCNQELQEHKEEEELRNENTIWAQVATELEAGVTWH